MNKHVQEHIVANHNALWVCNVNGQLICDFVRLEGLKVQDDSHLIIHIPAEFEDKILRNVRGNANLSVLVASAVTHESYQLKGKYVNHSKYLEEDKETRKLYTAGITEVFTSMKVDAAKLLGYMKDEGTSITMEVDTVFEQTPKQGTGNKVS